MVVIHTAKHTKHTVKWLTLETEGHVNVGWCFNPRTRTESVWLAVWPDLHHTSPGDDGENGQKRYSAKTYKHIRRLRSQTAHSIPTFWRGFSPPPSHLTSLSRSLSLTILALWKVQSCQGECQTTALSNLLNTHTDMVPHTFMRLILALLFSEKLRETFDTTLDWVTLFIIKNNCFSWFLMIHLQYMVMNLQYTRKELNIFMHQIMKRMYVQPLC